MQVEVPRFGVVKPRSSGELDFVSPLPCPYNYGCIPALTSPDGDPLDAVVLGPRLERGTALRLPVRAVVGFLDAGELDPKVICSASPLTELDRIEIIGFFKLYACCKGALNRLRRRTGATRCLGWQPFALVEEQGLF